MPIAGLKPTDALKGIDISRTIDNQLYGFSTNSTYVLNPRTGVASLTGTSGPSIAVPIGYDINR